LKPPSLPWSPLVPARAPPFWRRGRYGAAGHEPGDPRRRDAPCPLWGTTGSEPLPTRRAPRDLMPHRRSPKSGRKPGRREKRPHPRTARPLRERAERARRRPSKTRRLGYPCYTMLIRSGENACFEHLVLLTVTAPRRAPPEKNRPVDSPHRGPTGAGIVSNLFASGVLFC
jgi:hypothetical protein